MVWELPYKLNPVISLDWNWPITKLRVFLRGPHEKEAINLRGLTQLAQG